MTSYGDRDLGQHWHLNQCWLPISEGIWHSQEYNFRVTGQATILLNEFENYTFKITATCPKDDMSCQLLTHRGRVMHICVGKLTTIGSDNGLSPGWRQAIMWTNAGILLTGPLGTNFSGIFILNSNIFIQENALENVVCRMASILSRPQNWVLKWLPVVALCWESNADRLKFPVEWSAT